MIDLTARERARLFLAMTDAFGLPDHPTTSAQARRLALCELASGHVDGNRAPLDEAFRLAEAMEWYLEDHAEGPGPYGFTLANVAQVVGGDRATALAAIRLLGGRAGQALRGPEFTTADAGEIGAVEEIRFPQDILVTRLRADLEEVENYASS